MGTPLAVIGGGNMAKAILTRAKDQGLLDAGFVVADPNPEQRRAFPCAVESAAEAVKWLIGCEPTPGTGRIMLAIKPQVLPEVARELAPIIATDIWGQSRPVISILAGATIETIEKAFVGKARVVRVMPNTPALIGRGMTAISPAADAAETDRAFTRTLFEAVGKVIEIDEPQMDAFTALGGSGPAYVFLLAQAMAAAGQRAGLDHADALLTARETIAGAGLLLAKSDDLPETLKKRVTSKGGTTAAALAVLEGANFTDLIEAAILAARDRGAELARMAEQK
jgi:pyrroline-5-carboxylate reductase